MALLKSKVSEKAKARDTKDPSFDPMHTTSIMDTAKAQAVPWALPLIGNMPINRQYQILGALVGLCLVAAALFFFASVRETSNNAVYLTTATEMQMLSQRLAKGAQQAVLGNVSGFEQLRQGRDKFGADLNNLINGSANVPAATKLAQSNLDEISQLWAPMEQKASLILSQKTDLVNLGKNVLAINNNNPRLLELAQEVESTLTTNNAPVRAVRVASRQVMLTQKLAKNANALLSGELVDPEVAFLLAKDTNTFRDNLLALINGSEQLHIAPAKDQESLERLKDLQDAFKEFEGSVTSILQNQQKLIQAKQAGQSIFVDSEKLLASLQKLTDRFRAEAEKQGMLIAAILFAALMLIFLALMGFASVFDARRRALESERENKRNQKAILQLLNDMGDLAQGDLTVHAQVTAEITGAIADSINFTVDELRTLVTGINKATGQVTSATEQAKVISTVLLEAAQKQAQEIKDTTVSVLEMARSMNEVSANANQSAKVARQSLNAAEKGTAAVQNSISGMNEIREQIQETSKRIKRLGESSQEIGEIVELISDITEQTNVLALNAAIQAAAAGEAGRGFTVVAEEVQRLAERSAEATKQIGAIVKTIQTDTHDAVAAMEKSTQGVVEGAELSDAAGQALSEISDVSRSLAQLAATISSATQSQAESANRVAKNMQDILSITDQTTEGTKRTAVSIGQLAQLAAELKSSVSGFKIS
ncbi:MAG TPA: methyl-accepting chemotaxis protein [Burkholderiales bacterium]|nr:methyl-accepting chemotaxis protein [Burkholderiales bacterium]